MVIIKKFYMIFITIICIFLVGCKVEGSVNNTYVVKPSTLFKTEELKKLEPHLGLISGCVDVIYKGDKENLYVKYEIWENGKIKESHESIGNVITKDDKNKLINVSVSLQDNLILKNKQSINKNILTIETNKGNVRTLIDAAPIDYSTVRLNLQEPITKKDEEETSIFAITAHKENMIANRSIDDAVSKADWAVVFKVYFK